MADGLMAVNWSAAGVANASTSASALQARGQALGAGVAMGAVHAITGPDHMSALITLSVNQQWAAVWLGVRWGVGHSLGLLFVTAIVLLLKDAYGLDQDQVLEMFTSGMDWVVGVLMLALGLWGYRTAWLLRRKLRARLPAEVMPGSPPAVCRSSTSSPSCHVHDARRHACCEPEVSTAVDPTLAIGKPSANPHGESPPGKSPGIDICEASGATIGDASGEATGDLRSSGIELSADVAPDLVIVRAHPGRARRGMRRGSVDSCGSSMRRRCRSVASSPFATSLVALGVGILHGIGGPGGVLAVLPTLLLPGALSSALYLGGFCVAATVTMGAVAGVYGACTFRSRDVSPNLPWILGFVSASSSVLIGVVWLICSATGTLDKLLEAIALE